MKLYSLIIITEQYTGTTIYDFWKNAEINDRLVFRYLLQRGGKYQPTIKVVNLRTKQIFYAFPGDLVLKLNKMKFKEEMISASDIFDCEGIK